MTCDYCKTDHEAQNCTNCGAPRTSRAGHRAYRLPSKNGVFVEPPKLTELECLRIIAAAHEIPAHHNPASAP